MKKILFSLAVAGALISSSAFAQTNSGRMDTNGVDSAGKTSSGTSHKRGRAGRKAHSTKASTDGQGTGSSSTEKPNVGTGTGTTQSTGATTETQSQSGK